MLQLHLYPSICKPCELLHVSEGIALWAHRALRSVTISHHLITKGFLVPFVPSGLFTSSHSPTECLLMVSSTPDPLCYPQYQSHGPGLLPRAPHPAVHSRALVCAVSAHVNQGEKPTPHPLHSQAVIRGMGSHPKRLSSRASASVFTHNFFLGVPGLGLSHKKLPCIYRRAIATSSLGDCVWLVTGKLLYH